MDSIKVVILFWFSLLIGGCATSPEAWEALSYFVNGLAGVSSSYDQPKMPTPELNTYTPRSSAGSSGASYQSYWEESDCNGSVVNGRCIGTITPGATEGKCYGTMLNGECIGTELYY